MNIDEIHQNIIGVFAKSLHHIHYTMSGVSLPEYCHQNIMSRVSSPKYCHQNIMCVVCSRSEHNCICLISSQPVVVSNFQQGQEKNIARVRNCPDIVILNSLSGLLVLLSDGLFVFLYFCLFVFLSLSLFVFLSFCLVFFLYFCLIVFFVFLYRHHSDQMSEGSQVS